MKVRYFILLILGWMTLVNLPAQPKLSNWKQEAIIVPFPGATERFAFFEVDSILYPEGPFHWIYKGPADQDSLYWMVEIHSNFQNKKAHGEFKLLLYQVKLGIADFSIEQVNTKVEGFRIRVEGNFKEGLASGTWKFQHMPYPRKENQPGLSWTYDAQKQNWSFSGKRGQKSQGRTNKHGFMDGLWQVQIDDSTFWEASYNKGIISQLSLNQKEIPDSIFSMLNRHLEAGDSILQQSQKRPFVWENSFPPHIHFVNKQEPLALTLEKQFSPFDLLWTFLSSSQYFDVPRNKGLSSFYFSLSASNKGLLSEQSKQWIFQDSLLQDLLKWPVFTLRRAADESLDEDLKRAYELRLLMRQRDHELNTFMEKESRVLLPEQLPRWGKLSHAPNHDAYAEALIKEFSKLLLKVDSTRSGIQNWQSQLRQKGAIEDLENEWASAYTILLEEYQPDSEESFAKAIFSSFVKEDFKARNQQYQEIKGLEQRKEYLIESIDQLQWYKGFFGGKQYHFLTKGQEALIEAYTEWLYNPYTGKYNVERTLKRRFLNYILDDFWPWLIEELKNSQNHQAFVSDLEEARKIKIHLVAFAKASGTEARQLERIGRRSQDMASLKKAILAFKPPLDQENE